MKFKNTNIVVRIHDTYTGNVLFVVKIRKATLALITIIFFLLGLIYTVY